MNPQEALDLVDNVCGQLNATRADHLKIQEAISILRAAITKSATKAADK